MSWGSASLLRSAAMEYLEYDASLVRFAVAEGGTAAGRLLWRGRDKARPFGILSRIHRTGGSSHAVDRIEQFLAESNRLERSGQSTGLWTMYDQYVKQTVFEPQRAAIVKNPKMLLGYRVMVVKSPGERERGVIVIDYSYIFPLFAALYDVEAIAERYHFVFEPSWRGLCTADILSYSRYPFPKFIQTVEPRDAAFLKRLDANFIPVPIAANWWVDHRTFAPEAGVERDIDVVMIAAWSTVKRHWRFFRQLGELRRRGHRLRAALLGYPIDLTRADIEAQARHFGVADQIELHESLPLPQVARLLSRSQAHVLWSRKEGANRGLIEALFVDVPIVVREGLAYGHPYDYVNARTGRFAKEDGLGDALLDVIDRRRQFAPRQWAMENMTCQRATQLLEAAIKSVAVASGENWTRPLAVRTVQLATQMYWDPEEHHRFAGDYAFLEGCLRSSGAAR